MPELLQRRRFAAAGIGTGLLGGVLLLACPAGRAREADGEVAFPHQAQPVLARYCLDCHGDGEKEGGVVLDRPDIGTAKDPEFWHRVLVQLRTGLMPPAGKPRPTPEERDRLERWIQFQALGLDPANPDPGRVVLRRLNRIEYRNTVRDLLGVDLDTSTEFPPDDSGAGFDNNGQVLTVSPLLLEAYLDAARTIAMRARTNRLEAASAMGFPRGGPEDPAGRRTALRAWIRDFARRAFRRPVDDGSVDSLVALAEETDSRTGPDRDAGLARAVMAMLVSPRFLFREEPVPREPSGTTYPWVDEHSLASRLSYFLWSSMPDAALRQQADAGTLRTNLASEVRRMLADERAGAFIRQFTGQWLRTRDLESVAIDPDAVRLQEEPPNPELERLRQRVKELSAKPSGARSADEEGQFVAARERLFQVPRRPRLEFGTELRQALRDEVEHGFAHVVRQDRSVLELLDSDSLFLNERLALHYGLAQLGIRGPEFRRVARPPGNPRGGILTLGGVLVVTSNPTRTSPVKRGRFLLENLLGYPTPPPPPNIPPLEDSAVRTPDHEPIVREVLERHRTQPACRSCHDRLDPLGLALENFNALGQWRERESGRPIPSAGRLVTGESFRDLRELRQILVTGHRREFFRTLTEKLLTYALGRALDYRDVVTVDRIVERLEREDGRFSALLGGVIESAPFQRCRGGREAHEPP